MNIEPDILQGFVCVRVCMCVCLCQYNYYKEALQQSGTEVGSVSDLLLRSLARIHRTRHIKVPLGRECLWSKHSAFHFVEAKSTAESLEFQSLKTPNLYISSLSLQPP